MLVFTLSESPFVPEVLLFDSFLLWLFWEGVAIWRFSFLLLERSLSMWSTCIPSMSMFSLQRKNTSRWTRKLMGLPLYVILSRQYPRLSLFPTVLMDSWFSLFVFSMNACASDSACRSDLPFLPKETYLWWFFPPIMIIARKPFAPFGLRTWLDLSLRSECERSRTRPEGLSGSYSNASLRKFSGIPWKYLIRRLRG